MVFKNVVLNNKASIFELSLLATKIVREHFDPIIGKEQNDYMINKFQSVAAITEQLEHGYEYYFVCDESKNNIGFMAFYPRKDKMYLSKFYLDKIHRGKGYSKEMLKFVVKNTKKAKLSFITLNVNRDNSAVKVYEHLGFTKCREENNDIGNGFFMDDFVFKYEIQ